MCVVKSHLDLGGGRLVAKLCPTRVTPWTADHQAPQSMEFPRQEYWRGLPFPSPGDLPDPGIEPRSPILQADSLPTALGPGRPLRNSALPKVSSARLPGPRRQNLELPGVLWVWAEELTLLGVAQLGRRGLQIQLCVKAKNQGFRFSEKGQIPNLASAGLIAFPSFFLLHWCLFSTSSSSDLPFIDQVRLSPTTTTPVSRPALLVPGFTGMCVPQWWDNASSFLFFQVQASAPGSELPCWLRGKESACQCRRLRRLGSIPASGRSSGEGNGNSLQYSCLENFMERRA